MAFRLLPYSLVDDIFMIPEDPLGQYGPRIDEFLRMPSSCRLNLKLMLQHEVVTMWMMYINVVTQVTAALSIL